MKTTNKTYKNDFKKNCIQNCEKQLKNNKTVNKYSLTETLNPQIFPDGDIYIYIYIERERVRRGKTESATKPPPKQKENKNMFEKIKCCFILFCRCLASKHLPYNYLNTSQNPFKNLPKNIPKIPPKISHKYPQNIPKTSQK